MGGIAEEIKLKSVLAVESDKTFVVDRAML